MVTVNVVTIAACLGGLGLVAQADCLGPQADSCPVLFKRTGWTLVLAVPWQHHKQCRDYYLLLLLWHAAILWTVLCILTVRLSRTGLKLENKKKQNWYNIPQGKSRWNTNFPLKGRRSRLPNTKTSKNCCIYRKHVYYRQQLKTRLIPLLGLIYCLHLRQMRGQLEGQPYIRVLVITTSKYNHMIH